MIPEKEIAVDEIFQYGWAFTKNLVFDIETIFTMSSRISIKRSRLGNEHRRILYSCWAPGGRPQVEEEWIVNWVGGGKRGRVSQIAAIWVSNLWLG
jgi:hypothetical protein